MLQRLVLGVELEEEAPLVPEVDDGGHVGRQRVLHRARER